MHIDIDSIEDAIDEEAQGGDSESLTNESGEGKESPRDLLFKEITLENKPEEQPDEEEDDEVNLDNLDDPDEDDPDEDDPDEDDPDEDDSDEDDSDEDDSDEDDSDDEEVDPEEEVDVSDIVEIDASEIRKKIPKKLWNSMPKEAKSLIVEHRKYSDAQNKKLKEAQPYADVAVALLDKTTKAGISGEGLEKIIHYACNANTGSEDALAFFGNLAVKGGWQPEATNAEIDTSDLNEYLHDLIHEEYALSKEQAKNIVDKIKIKVNKSAKSESQKQPEKQQQMVSSTEQESAEVNRQILKAESRYEAEYGEHWQRMRKRIHDEMILQSVRNPVPTSKQVEAYIKVAKKVEAAHRKKVKAAKAAKGKSRTGKGGLAAGRGIKSAGGKKLSPREEFFEEHTY